MPDHPAKKYNLLQDERKEHSMAEKTFQKSSITIEAAQRVIAAAEAKAHEMGAYLTKFAPLLT